MWYGSLAGNLILVSRSMKLGPGGQSPSPSLGSKKDQKWPRSFSQLSFVIHFMQQWKCLLSLKAKPHCWQQTKFKLDAVLYFEEEKKRTWNSSLVQQKVLTFWKRGSPANTNKVWLSNEYCINTNLCSQEIRQEKSDSWINMCYLFESVAPQ